MDHVHELIPEPPPGSVVFTEAHEWRRAWLTNQWWGCATCDGDEVTSWSWELVLWDCYDDVITVHVP